MLITKKEQFGKAVESTDPTTGNPEDDGDAPSPDISDDELEKAADMSRQRMQKFGYEDSDVTGQALPENKARNIKAITTVLQTLRKVDGKTKGHRMAMMDLLTIFSPKEIERAYKANPRGFTNLMNIMYPRNKDALTISDLTVNGQFMAKTGRLLSVDQTKQLGNPLDKIKESGDEDIPPHTDIQESDIGDKLMKSSDGDSVNTDIIRRDPMKFHNPKFGKPIVAHCYSTDDGHFDFIFFSDGKYVLGVPGHRQEHPGRYPSPDEEAFIFPLKKSSYNDFKKEVMSAAKGMFNAAPMKVLKFDTKIRDFKGKTGPNDPRGRGTGPSQFKIDRMPKTTFREEVEYHDRESMPSAVDDAADVMSSYTKFLKSTKTYY